MADFDSSLPVRTQNATDVKVSIADNTITSQFMTVNADGSINVNGLNFDIRDLVFATDKVDVSGSVIALDAPTLAALESITVQNGAGAAAVNIQDGGNSITVDAVNLDIRDLVFATDKVDVSGSTITVTSTDDHNYGVVGANTLRTAAQIGNATGAADFNYGVIGAQSLRVASQIGNATGAADFNAGATGAQTLRTTSNQGAPNTNANGWFVRLTDGTDNVTVSAAGELNVLATAQPGVDIGDVTVNNGAGAAAVNIQDGGNSITVDGAVTVSNFPTTVDTNYGVVGANTIRTASQIGNATGAADFNVGATTAQTLRVEANQGEANAVGGAWPVLLTDGVDTVAVNTDGSINVVISDATPGTPVNDYKRAIGVAAGASDNHDYTVTAGKTLYLNQIEASSSGKAKMNVSIETGVATGVFNDRWVQFNSTATPNMMINPIQNPIPVAAGVRVRVVMKNQDLTAQDLYSTISGYELP